MDQFDLEKLKLRPETARPAGAVPKRLRKQRERFVQVPLTLIETLGRISRDKTLVVACLLLHEHWRQRGRPVKVPNGMLATLGVGRGAKRRALEKLEAAGLISIERRDNKSPIVTINKEQ
jgi:hypothetical protein